MRVLMFCPQFAPLVGGAERQAELLGKTLCRGGVKVCVVTPRMDASSPADETVSGLHIKRFRLSDLVARFPLRGIALLNAPRIAFQVMWRVWLDSRDSDIVHCHIGSLQSVAAAWAARLRGIPVICKAGVADDRSDLGEAAKNGLTGRFIAWAGRWTFTCWVATTQEVKEALLRAGVEARRIVIIPNGVDVPASSARISSGRPVQRFLYLGRLSANTQRDVPGLIQAFDILASDLPNVELAVVGDGDLLADTRAAASACRHASRIQVTGPGDPGEWIRWAGCLVLPSRREGLSNALLEAMAAGLPCIAYDIPPNREVLADGAAGVLVTPGDTAALVAAMRQFAMDARHVSSVANAGLNRVASEYEITSIAQRYVQLYWTLVDPTTGIRV